MKILVIFRTCNLIAIEGWKRSFQMKRFFGLKTYLLLPFPILLTSAFTPNCSYYLKNKIIVEYMIKTY